MDTEKHTRDIHIIGFVVDCTSTQQISIALLVNPEFINTKNEDFRTSIASQEYGAITSNENIWWKSNFPPRIRIIKNEIKVEK